MNVLKKTILNAVLSSKKNLLRRVLISLKSMLSRNLKEKVRTMLAAENSLSILQSKKSIYFEQFKPVLDSMKSDV